MTEKERRKKILINKPFQLKWAVYFVAISFVTTLAVGTSIYLMTQTTNQFILAYGLHRAPDIFDYISRQRTLIYGSLATIFVLLSVVLFFIGVALTHRVAGPIYALNRKMREMIDGNYSNTLHFRKKDEFRFLEDSYNELLETIKTRRNLDLQHIAALEILIRGNIPQDIASSLRTELRAYRTEKEGEFTA